MEMFNGFELAKDLIYLNHAAVAPWPVPSRDAVVNFARENAQLGSKRYAHWLQTEAELRERLARLIHAPSSDDIALLKNTSEALSVIAHGIDWQAGDNVVISNEEFPSNRIVWESLQSSGVEVIQVDLHSAETPAASLIAATNRQTRLLSVSSVQYASGLRVDLNELGLHCKKQKILFCVDAIQSIGALQTDVNEMQADFVVADGHKWMLGPEGLALFYSTPEAREQLQLRQYGWHMVEEYTDFEQKEWRIARSARRFECGSPNMLGIHALHASIGLLLETGMETVQQRVLENSRYLFQLLENSRHLECLTDMTAGRYAGIVVFRHRQAASDLLYHYLMQNNVMCALRGGGIRFSPHFYTPRSQIQQAVTLADGFNPE